MMEIMNMLIINIIYINDQHIIYINMYIIYINDNGFYIYRLLI